jgi:hypothetical protein
MDTITMMDLTYDIQAQGLFNMLPSVSVMGFKSVDGSKQITSTELAAFAADTTSDACTLPNEGTTESKCSFYSGCAEKHVPCGKKGYMMSYGDYYCEKFVALEFETQYAKDWRDQTLVCLQTNLQDILREPTGAPLWVAPSTCEDVATKAFDSHEPCYVAQETNVCNICEHSFEDLMKIFTTVEMQEYGNTKSWKALVGVLGSCAGGITSDYLTNCAANLLRMTADAAISNEVLAYMHTKIKQVDLNNGLLAFSDSAKRAMVTTMMDVKDKSLKGMMKKLWVTPEKVRRLGIPSMLKDIATDALDRGLDMVQGTIDGLVEHTDGDCALGQGIFGFTFTMKGTYDARYILPAGAKVGSCLKKVSSYFLCGIMEHVMGLKAVGTVLDYAQNNMGISVGFGFGGGSARQAGIGLSTLKPVGAAIYLSCDLNKYMPNFIYEVHKLALVVKDALQASSSVASAAASMFINSIVGSDMSENDAQTTCAASSLKEPKLMKWGGPNSWSAKLSAKIGFPGIGVTFSATVKSSWVVDFIRIASEELIDVMSDTLKTTFDVDGLTESVWDYFVEGAKKLVVAQFVGVAAVCGEMTFSAKINFDMKKVDENGFTLAFECADMPSLSEVVQGLPRLGCGNLGVCPFGPADKNDPEYPGSDAEKIDACTAQAKAKKFGIALSVEKFMHFADFAPPPLFVQLVHQHYAFSGSVTFDGAITHLFNKNKLDCMPPPSAMSVGKMLFAIWSESARGFACAQALARYHLYTLAADPPPPSTLSHRSPNGRGWPRNPQSPVQRGHTAWGVVARARQADGPNAQDVFQDSDHPRSGGHAHAPAGRGELPVCRG